MTVPANVSANVCQCGHGRPDQRVWLQMRQIHLLVFDEAHHCMSRDPGNVIMQQFYHTGQGLKVRRLAGGPGFLEHHVKGKNMSDPSSAFPRMLATP